MWASNLRKPGLFPDVEPPDAAVIMLNTRMLNDWTGAGYTMEQVAEMDPLLFDVMVGQKQGMYPVEK